MRRSIFSFVMVCGLIAAPAVVAADNAPATDLRAAYCTGYHIAQEQDYGDVCIEANAGWENGCSDIIRAKNRLAPELMTEQAANAGAGAAIASGQDDYKQCGRDSATADGVAHMQACRKNYTGQQLNACIAAGPATPSCQRLRMCDE